MTTHILQLLKISRLYHLDQSLELFKNSVLLSQTLQRLTPYVLGNYLHDNFVLWLSNYANAREKPIKEYLSGKIEIPILCSDFVEYCFANNINLDKERTLASFIQHDAISDKAVKKELKKLRPQEQVNLLGFGLGTGYYEKSIRQYLLDKKLANKVEIYGFDPYAPSSPDIKFLTQADLNQQQIPRFDIILARWVLHHIEMKSRWHEFIASINKGKSGSLILIVEHGYLSKTLKPEQERLYKLLVSTFDIVANIGIRPALFTATTPPGKNFYVDYLKAEDFSSISKGLHLPHTKTIYEVGPGFPNQTICSLRMR